MMAFIYIFTFSGCKGDGMSSSPNESFEMKIAVELVQTYMNDLFNENYLGARKLLTKETSDKTSSSLNNQEKLVAFKVIEENQVGKNGEIKVRASRVNSSLPSATLDEYTFKVVNSGKSYAIDEVQDDQIENAFAENNSLRFRNFDKAKNNLLLEKSGISDYFNSRIDYAKMYKVAVPKQRFETMSFSYDGDNMVFSTYDGNSYIGMAQIDQSLASDTPSQGSSGSGQVSMDMPLNERERPLAKKIINFDVLKNSLIDFAIFSNDEKYIIAQYTKSNSAKCLKIYSSGNGEEIPFKFENNFPSDKVDMIFVSQDNDVLNYKIVKKADMTQSEMKYLGNWQLNYKEMKNKKL